MKMLKEELQQIKLIADWRASIKHDPNITSLKYYSKLIYRRLLKKETDREKRQTDKIKYTNNLKKLKRAIREKEDFNLNINDPYEEKIFNMIKSGYSVKEISKELNIHKQNIYNSIKRIREKYVFH